MQYILPLKKKFEAKQQVFYSLILLCHRAENSLHPKLSVVLGFMLERTWQSILGFAQMMPHRQGYCVWKSCTSPGLCLAEFIASFPPLQQPRQEEGWRSLLHSSSLYSRMIKTPCGAYYQPYGKGARVWEKHAQEQLVNVLQRAQWEWESEEEWPGDNASKRSSEDREARLWFIWL